MIKDIKYKVDKNDIVGLKSDIIVQSKHEMALDKPFLRIESLIMLGENYRVLGAMKTNNNIFNATSDYSKTFYFPFLNVQFLGKAIVKINSQYDILSMAISEVDYSSFPIVDVISQAVARRNPGAAIDGSIPVIWRPIQSTPVLNNAVRMFCNTFIY